MKSRLIRGSFPLIGLLAAAFAASAPEIRFSNVAAESGINFVLAPPVSAGKRLPETVLGGIAIFDYDKDGHLDIFFANAADLPSGEKRGPAQWDRLYRNLGDWNFQDVTEKAGVRGEGYSMGAAAADYDNDGWPDLFVPGLNRGHLYRNRGDGTFEDKTAAAGIHSPHWAAAAGWFDYDRDGFLDLFLVNYLDWSAQDDRFCGEREKNLRVYCHPRYYGRLPNQLFRNRGDGTFIDVSKESGIASHSGKGMSVVFADYDGDEWPDAFVTNDGEPDFLFHNLGNGTFEEVGLIAGVAVSPEGKAISSMGADFRDYNNDGRPDLTITALARESFPLFRSLSDGSFEDHTYSSGLGPLVRNLSGWSNALADFDNDGWKDLFTANSHVNDEVERLESMEYKQANTIFRNQSGRFVLIPEAMPGRRAHRGAAVADLDNDGRLDVVVSAIGEPAELWRNRTHPAGHWIALRLRGTRGNRDGIGARIELAGQFNDQTSAVGYASSALTPIHFGLGSRTAAVKATIRWPSGTVQQLEDLAVDQIVEVTEPE